MSLEQQIVSAALTAGRYIRKNAFLQDIYWKKKDDPVTNLDKGAEQLVRDTLGNSYNYIGEEYGKQDNGSAITLHIDPIDGTRSFILQEFYSSLSIGVEKNHELIGGIVYDFMRDILYAGLEGKFYRLHNGEKLPFEIKYPLSKYRVCIDNSPKHDAIFEKQENWKSIRKHGSVALALAELATGTYHAFICNGTGNSWDIAGGIYLIQGNGHTVKDYHFKDFNFNCASNGIIAIRKEAQKEVEGIIPSCRRD